MDNEEYVAELTAFLRTYLHSPYVHGGNYASGIDCSGLACAALRKYGLIGLHEDLSAQALYDKLRGVGFRVKSPTRAFPAGTFLFYGASKESIEHVAISMDFYSCIEAGGGNSRTDSVEKAQKIGACVREVSVHFRSDLIEAWLPPWPWEVDPQSDEVRN